MQTYPNDVHGTGDIKVSFIRVNNINIACKFDCHRANWPWYYNI